MLWHLFTDLPLETCSLYYAEAAAAALPCMAGSVGRSRITEATYDWHGLKRGIAEFALMQYTIAGRGALRVGGQEWSITPGTAMLLTFPADNRYWFPAGDSAEWEFFYICLHGPEIMRTWPRLMRALSPVATLEAAGPPVQLATALARDALRGHLADPYECSGRAYALLMSLLAAASERGRGGPSTLPQPHSEALDRAREYGELNFAKDLGVAELAAVAGLSRYHFTRLFTRHTGLPPAAWLVEIRIREAARLLRETELSIKEIASRAGFQDAGYLGKVFQRRHGQPPQAYRRSGV